jgi:hypothetical protein
MDLEKEKTPDELPVAHPHHRDHQTLAIALDLESSSSEDGQDSDLEAATSRRSEHHSIGRVVTAQDWTGPDDPENPHNWSLLKRSWHVAQPGLFGFAVYVY